MSESADAMGALTPQQLAHERQSIVECAVTALIHTHENPNDVRVFFDQLYAQHQLARIQAGAPVETPKAVQKLIDMLFQSKP